MPALPASWNHGRQNQESPVPGSPHRFLHNLHTECICWDLSQYILKTHPTAGLVCDSQILPRQSPAGGTVSAKYRLRSRYRSYSLCSEKKAAIRGSSFCDAAAVVYAYRSPFHLLVLRSRMQKSSLCHLPPRTYDRRRMLTVPNDSRT